MAADRLQLVVVTPETTVLDQEVASLRFPLYDGQIGILPGRAPLVGRLGYGELRLTDASGSHSYFLDGGFVQVNGSVVTILTDAALPAQEIDTEKASEQLTEFNSLIPTSDEAFSAKQRDVDRARQMLAMGKRF